MVIYSDRDVFIGGHVTPEVREALKQESRDSKTSMSRIIYESIVARLQSKGHNVEVVDDFNNTRHVT